MGLTNDKEAPLRESSTSKVLRTSEIRIPPIPSSETHLPAPTRSGNLLAPTHHSGANLPPTKSGNLQAGTIGRPSKSFISLAAEKAFAVTYETKDEKYFEDRILTKSDLGVYHIFSVCIISIAVILAELMTMLPFIGGLATFTRAAFGPYLGYMIGQCELAEYTIFLAGNINGLATNLNNLAQWDQKYIPAWWFIIFTICFGIQVIRNKLFFGCFCVLCVLCLGVVLAFTLPQISVANSYFWADHQYFQETFNSDVNSTTIPYNQVQALFPLGITGVVNSVPFVMGDFQGLEIIPLMAEECRDFITDGPRAMFATSATFISLYWLLILVIASVPPGLYGNESFWYPMINTFAGFLGLDPEGQTYNTLCYWIGALYLSRSGLMPQFLSITTLPYKTERVPWASYLFGCLMALFFILLSYFEPSVSGSLAVITNALGPAGFLYLTLMYGSTCVSFVYLRYKYPSFKRPFKSALGIPCAVYALAVCVFVFVAIVMNEANYVAVSICAGKLVLGMIHMWFHRKHLVMSPEEEAIQKVEEEVYLKSLGQLDPVVEVQEA
ncbi:hypothetical protein BCR33DRAFT_740508 [Rhizoclosmatium globosum]|uniref:Amino acid permease/ SLC12A domain-containing protein n=1 Tax=Rhizoclosmatium globosum TaxID=329046 RepID=A0A1Y2BZQ3_9FUNG|nr:hypothetical protein BCR33DRAFT_740508 [Rhizoclosmatium globosum]|eukprot:ORY40262.1 hypothetical protein BCR33DRAFT_740508 [Rhizoclosmatium globosum]